MIAASVVLAAYAVGWCLIALIQERPRETRTAGVSGVAFPVPADHDDSAKTTSGVRLPDKLPAALPVTAMWHVDLPSTERDPRSQVVTGGPDVTLSGRTTSHRRATVPLEGEEHSRIGVGHRAGVGTHRVSRVPVRMAQPARRRGGRHRVHPTRKAPFRAPRGLRRCRGELPTHPAHAPE